MAEVGRRKSRRGSEVRKRSFLVTSRYDEQEFAELEEASRRAGLTRASYQRLQSLEKPKTRSTRRAPVERELLGKVLGQLGKIGSNLNQIARAANSNGGLDDRQRADVSTSLLALRALLPLLLKALGRPMTPTAKSVQIIQMHAGAGVRKR